MKKPGLSQWIRDNKAYIAKIIIVAWQQQILYSQIKGSDWDSETQAMTVRNAITDINILFRSMEFSHLQH